MPSRYLAFEEIPSIKIQSPTSGLRRDASISTVHYRSCLQPLTSHQKPFTVTSVVQPKHTRHDVLPLPVQDILRWFTSGRESVGLVAWGSPRDWVPALTWELSPGLAGSCLWLALSLTSLLTCFSFPFATGLLLLTYAVAFEMFNMVDLASGVGAEDGIGKEVAMAGSSSRSSLSFALHNNKASLRATEGGMVSVSY